MGCFFTCFRFNAGPRSPLPSLETTPCKTTQDRSFAKNQVASLLLSDDGEDSYEVHSGRNNTNRELRHEAKLLKACGVLFQTPQEIKETSKTACETFTHDEHKQPDTSAKKLQWEEPADQISNSPPSEPVGSSQAVSQRNRCMSVGEQTVETCACAAHLTEPQCAVVHIGNESASSITEDYDGQESAKYASNHLSPEGGQQVLVHVSKDFPYPTPLKLTDGLETPGTLYPRGHGNNNQTRSQYVFPIRNHISEAKRMTEGLPSPTNHPCELSLQLAERGISSNALLSVTDLKVNHVMKSKQRSPASKSPEMDRPIMGIVAAHWNGGETTHISPTWDGNGIPNSTTKYKEDQRVSWHATPFEERLEKALSDEKLFPQRKLLNGKPIEFDEEDRLEIQQRPDS